MNEIPERWHSRVTDHIRRESDEARSALAAGDFKTTVNLRFPDGSFACFKYAIFLTDEEANEVAVFTEHCGYHIFPFAETEIEYISPN